MKNGYLALTIAVMTWLPLRVAAAYEPSPAQDLTDQATQALVQGRTGEALVRADAAIKADPRFPWAHYCRAEALVSLRRFDEAVTAYEAAASRLPATDARSRALCAWGRASSMRQSGRCVEARTAFADYAALMKPIDPRAAAQAEPMAAACQSPDEPSAAKPPAASPAPSPRSSSLPLPPPAAPVEPPPVVVPLPQ